MTRTNELCLSVYYTVTVPKHYNYVGIRSYQIKGPNFRFWIPEHAGIYYATSATAKIKGILYKVAANAMESPMYSMFG